MIQSLGGLCKGYKVDISNKEEVYKYAQIIQEDIGDVTLLFNNAGVVSGRALLDTPDHLIERSFSVNVLAHFWRSYPTISGIRDFNVPAQKDSQSCVRRERPEWDSNLGPARSKTGAAIFSAINPLPTVYELTA
uniref:Uncharacterized protein n=1 Tax=Anopheles culicifacies TaxID=139723 RepID=A0A182M2I9_9DIPT